MIRTKLLGGTCNQFFENLRINVRLVYSGHRKRVDPSDASPKVCMKLLSNR